MLQVVDAFDVKDLLVEKTPLQRAAAVVEEDAVEYAAICGCVSVLDPSFWGLKRSSASSVWSHQGACTNLI